MTQHSALVGGSTAARLLNCAASFQETLKQPPARLTSEYAEEGTAMHDAIAWLLKGAADDLRDSGAQITDDLPSRAQLAWNVTFNDRAVSQTDVDDLIRPALQRVVDICKDFGGGFRIAAIETQVQYPGVPGAFGTVDLILTNGVCTIVVDFKFGRGVRVPMLYRLPDGDVLNEQVMFYILAAKHTNRILFSGRPIIVGAIVQPTFDDDSHTAVEIGDRDLRDYKRAMARAVVDALQAAPQPTRGEWCRFAACKATCPLWTGPLIDLSMIDHPKTALQQSVKPNGTWGLYLANAKRLVDSALQYRKSIDEALVDHLKAGGEADGFALKPKSKDRQWLDDVDRVANALEALGFAEEDIWAPEKLTTFKAADAAAKRLGVTIPDELRPKPPTNEVTLTTVGDPEAIDMTRNIEEFRASLKALR